MPYQFPSVLVADIFTILQTSDFSKFVIGALVAGSIYLIVTKVSDKLTSRLVRKDELATTLHEFKSELIKELVTSQDLKIFKLEHGKELEDAMKESRHALRSELQSIKSASDEAALLMAQRMTSIETVLARIDEHIKISHPLPK